MVKKMTEEFRDVPGWEGLYKVNANGVVISYQRKNPIKLRSANIKGYKVVTFFRDGKSRHYGLHQLVAMAFLGHTPCGHKKVIDHIDNNPLNNHYTNLQIVDNRLNTNKGWALRNPKSKYAGVTAHWNKWRARITVNGVREDLGLFKTQEEAHNAYQKRLKEIT